MVPVQYYFAVLVVHNNIILYELQTIVEDASLGHLSVSSSAGLVWVYATVLIESEYELHATQWRIDIVIYYRTTYKLANESIN